MFVGCCRCHRVMLSKHTEARFAQRIGVKMPPIRVILAGQAYACDNPVTVRTCWNSYIRIGDLILTRCLLQIKDTTCQEHLSWRPC